MPTTRKAAAPQVAEAEFTEPPGRVATLPDEGVGDLDPRAGALAALINAPTGAVVDRGATPEPVVVSRPIPRRTNARLGWSEKGAWYLVLSPVYPRMIGEVRMHARAGDIIRVPDDDRTAADLTAGYLIPEDNIPEE